MATQAKNLNTRIALKYDSYANWQQYNPILLKGEIAIATLPEGNSAGVGEPNAPGSTPAIQNTPNLLIKVGDGVNHYSDLKFVSALAADVYSWAKAATKPEYSANEITGLTDYVNNTIKDTNTQYRIVAIEDGYSYKLQSKEIDGDWTDVNGSVISLTNIDNRLDILEAAIKEDGSVGTQISNAIEALDYEGKAADQGKFVTNVTQADGKITVVASNLVDTDIPALPQSKITGLETALAGKQDNLEFETAYNAVSNKVATMSDVTSAIEALDGETAVDASSATKVVAEVTQSDGKITVQKVAVADILPDYEDEGSGFVASVNQTDGEIKVTHKSATELLGFAGNYDESSNPIATKSYVDDEIREVMGDVNGAMHFIGSVAADPTVTAPVLPEGKEAWIAGDVVLFGYDEYVYDGSKWVALGNESIYAKDAEVDAEFVKVRQELADEKAALQDEISDSISDLHDTVSGEISSAIEDLDAPDTAVEKQFVTAVSETDGKISVSRAALKASDIPTIEQSQVNGLITALNGKQDVVPFENTPTNDDKAATVKSITERIEALDSSISDTTSGDNVAAITGFSIADGKIDSATIKKVTLHQVAKTGKVEHLEQEELVIINCGSANTNITASDAAALSIPNNE